MKVLDLEKRLLQDCFELKIDNDDDNNISSTIIDEELDPINVSFHYDGCVNINTEGLEYIILSERHLMNLIEMIKKADKMYENIYKK
jgi:hypothetical protein